MSGPPRVDGFRRRVKRGKEGLGCVSLPPSGAHLPSPQQSRTVRSGQEPRQRSQTAEPRCFPYHLDFSTYARLSHRLSIRLPPLASVISVLPSVFFRRSRLEFSHAKFASLPPDRSTWRIFNIFIRKEWLLFRRSRFSRQRNRRRTCRGCRWRWSCGGGDGDGCVVVLLVLVKKRKKKKKTEYIGGGNSSLLPRTGGGRQHSKIVVT